MPDFHLFFYFFFLFFLIQLYFQLGYFLKLALYKPKDHNTNANPPVSVIICAHNELENLKKRLNSILLQDYPVFEVILVDDRSTDGTYEWLLNLQKKFPWLRIVRVDETPAGFNPKKYALTVGINTAAHEIILLTDADCKAASENWIANMAHSYKADTSIVLGVSLYERQPGILNAFIRYETLQTAILYLSLAMAGKPYMGVGRNLSYRKSLFLANTGFKGYQKITGGDDDLFVNKHSTSENTEICIDKQATLYSKPKKTIRKFIHQKKRHLSVGKHYQQKDKVRLGLYHFSQSMLWIFLIFGFINGHIYESSLIILMMLIRWAGQYVVFFNISTKFGESNKLWMLPVLELVFILYYWLTGVSVLLSKKVKWK